ncbi:hypothetical protein NDU88_003656 [Pleurodeles waltl]|uniref:CobW C-terminal domain-containing protein n=1 Tax=Pleurodeles waltl TaxID=8319 RepID=A0AAV7SGI8_PLEWA|nr:hypothetical protein NDU88_003656 [Pleurodeles waltl]
MTEEDCSDLQQDIQLMVLSESERRDLEAELMEEEVADVLRELQLGKAAGPNGLLVEFFKFLGGKVMKHMLAMFKEAQEVGQLPLDQRTTMVLVGPKKDLHAALGKLNINPTCRQQRGRVDAESIDIDGGQQERDA